MKISKSNNFIKELYFYILNNFEYNDLKTLN
jgi:hypothetical protein